MISKKPQRILVFNPLKKLIGVFHSTLAASKAFNVRAQAIHYACTGRCISCNNLYFRHLSDDIEISMEDFGTLRVEEYDKAVGIERKVYRNKNMTRSGMKYQKQSQTTHN